MVGAWEGSGWEKHFYGLCVDSAIYDSAHAAMTQSILSRILSTCRNMYSQLFLIPKPSHRAAARTSPLGRDMKWADCSVCSVNSLVVFGAETLVSDGSEVN